MARRRSGTSVGSLAANSAVAGFGFSAGRSTWRSVDRNWQTITFFLLLVAGSGFAGFYLRRGSGRGIVSAFFMVFIPCLFLIGLSIFMCLAAGGFSGSIDVARYLLAWQAVAFLFGISIAQPVRRRRNREREVAAHNAEFIQKIGLQDLGGNQATWLDAEGRELVLDDARADAIVFRVKGMRGGRTLIRTNDEGRMVAYEPARHQAK